MLIRKGHPFYDFVIFLLLLYVAARAWWIKLNSCCLVLLGFFARLLAAVTGVPLLTMALSKLHRARLLIPLVGDKPHHPMDLIPYLFTPLILFCVPYTLDLLPYYLSIANGAGGVVIFELLVFQCLV